MQPRRSTRVATAAVAAKQQPAPAAAPAPAPSKRGKRSATATKKKVAPSNKKRKTGLKGAIHATAALGVIDPESNIDGTIQVLDREACDVMLVFVDPAKHMDKFFILQLIERAEGSHVVYTRWGRTGTSGQGLEQDFDEHDDAVQCFENIFEKKTGLEWEDRSGTFLLQT